MQYKRKHKGNTKAIQRKYKSKYKGNTKHIEKKIQSNLLEMLNKAIKSNDAKEGISAFKEKRKPNWKGR